MAKNKKKENRENLHTQYSKQGSQDSIVNKKMKSRDEDKTWKTNKNYKEYKINPK